MERQVLCPLGTSKWDENRCDDEIDQESERNIFHLDLGECDSVVAQQIVDELVNHG